MAANYCAARSRRTIHAAAVIKATTSAVSTATPQFYW
jgi:hypothetical protein